jgi:hypothetical protein
MSGGPTPGAAAPARANRRAALRTLGGAAVLAAAWPGAALARPDLAVGQVWSIKATPPTPAKVIIGRIGAFSEARTAVSVCVVDVPTDHGPTTIGHLPFDEPALVDSLDQLLETGRTPPPVFEQGYQQWREARGGVFTIPIAQVIAMALNEARNLAAHPPPVGTDAHPAPSAPAT